MLLPSLIPVTADAVVRNLFRVLDSDERRLLLTNHTTRDDETKAAYSGLQKKLLTHFLHVYELAKGNPELVEDVKGRQKDIETLNDVINFLFSRLLERTWLEREKYPQTLAEAAIILKAELSDGERGWLMVEPLDDHGLLMRELVTWCMTRFGLEGENTALVDEIMVMIQRDGERYSPRLAARYVIQQLVLTELADHPETAARVMHREHEKKMKRDTAGDDRTSHVGGDSVSPRPGHSV